MNRLLILVGVATFSLSARAQTAAPKPVVFGKIDIADQEITVYHFEPNPNAEVLFFSKGYLHHYGSFITSDIIKNTTSCTRFINKCRIC